MNRSSALLSKALWGAARTSKSARFATAKFLLQGSCTKSLPSAFAPLSSQRFMSSQTLSDILARELAEEKEEGRDTMPPELADLKSDIEKDWKIVDDGATTRMIRTAGASKVVITFHCQDSIEGADEMYDAEEGEEPAGSMRFEVLVSKAGNTLILNCISQGGEVLVDGVATSTDDLESIQLNGINKNHYQGPEFSELAEDLQDAFCEFVFSEIGVNEDVAAFVAMYADYKEQLEYVNFLKNAPKALP